MLIIYIVKGGHDDKKTFVVDYNIRVGYAVYRVQHGRG